MILALALFLWAPPSPAWSGEAAETAEKAYGDFLAGRLGDAAGGYRYLATLGVESLGPDINLALLARDQGLHEQALAHWVKASLLPGADGFVWNQKGWAYIALDRTREARESFLKALERSSTTATQAEANLGLGVTALLDSKPRGAMSPLRDALIQGPYIVPAAAYQTALTALAVGDKQAALAYLRQSFNQDPTNLEALRALGRLYMKIGENESAWRAYRRLLSFDPQDADAAHAAKKALKNLPGPPADVSLRRLSRPMLTPSGKGLPDLPRSTATVRVALFSDDEGRPATARHLFIMANAPFRLVSVPTGEVVKEDGRAHDQWEIVFQPENNLVEVRDAVRNIQYTTKQPFRIVPQAAQGSVLLKNAEFQAVPAFDASDRELRGSLEIRPTPYGFELINELPLEQYLFGVVGAALPQGSPREAYKAQAVYSRTVALWHMSRFERPSSGADLCDSDRCQRYQGLNGEMLEATKAVGETAGKILRLSGKPASLAAHANCGGMTEDPLDAAESRLSHLSSVHDGPTPARAPRAPADLERWLHEFPPRDRFCEAGTLSAAAESRWVRILEADELERRLDRARSIGSLRHLRIARRSKTGRVLAVEAVGSRGSALFEGPKAVREFLSPGTLRSNLFAVQPLMRGNRAARFMLWGAGTGEGLGMCSAGALGQASLGRGWRDILAHYFPGLQFEPLPAKPKTLKAAPAAGKKRPLNPRKKKGL